MDQPSSERTLLASVTADGGPGCVLEDRPPSPSRAARHRAAAAVGMPSERGWLAAQIGLAPNKTPWRSPWRVLTHPDMKRYFIGSVASDFGTWIQNTAQVLLAYKLTHSVLAVGLVTCAQFSSPLVLGPWAGVMANRFGSKPTLLGTQVLSALFAAALGFLQFTHQLTERYLIVGAVAIGLFFTFALPARTVTVRTLVPEKEVKAAMAMNSVPVQPRARIGPRA